MPTAAQIKKCLTDSIAQDIIDTAAEGGITYWAMRPTQAEFDALPEGKTWTIVEGIDDRNFGGKREVDGVHYLNADDVREAYAKLLDLDQGYVNSEIHGYIVQSWLDKDEEGIETGMIDADAADAIVQVALFGDLVYS
ncbi:hypothetical protein [Streptomyces sp. NRRL F-5123]|uniref:hypothetical protein n=1 Tax=Streptomyces sp. NRRL F-5123 TaxID=1463856 RepID=UPI0004E23FF7|nr:hypothetical protein [Streptomyces sp. NRRL F-5123]